jgi:ABC-type amino acid transport system permease subunit
MLGAYQADMLKKTAFIFGLLASLILTLMQISGLASLNDFTEAYQKFGMGLPAYMEFFWILPVLCVAAAVWAIKRPSGRRVALVLSMSLLGFAAIFVALYMPIVKLAAVV